MEQKNRVELCGYVGKVKEIPGGLEFAVATSRVYNNAEKQVMMETTWTNVSKLGGYPELKKGDPVEVVGRIRNVRYTNSDGEEVSVCSVVAEEVKIIREDKVISQI